MEQNSKQLMALPITFELYAYDEAEIEECRQAIVAFIDQHRCENRAVTAGKVAQALRRWDRNALVRNEIIKYFT